MFPFHDHEALVTLSKTLVCEKCCINDITIHNGKVTLMHKAPDVDALCHQCERHCRNVSFISPNVAIVNRTLFQTCIVRCFESSLFIHSHARSAIKF